MPISNSTFNEQVFVKLKTSFVQIDCGFLNEFELEFDVLNDNKWLIAKFMNFGDK